MMFSRRVLWAARALCAAAVCALLVVAARADIMTRGEVLDDMKFVTIGNPYNDPASADNTDHGDTGAYTFGKVDYVYDIGKYMVTDPHYEASGLPRPWDGIMFPTGDNAPVNFVSWENAARFTNWLTTGDEDKGVYNTSDWTVINPDRTQLVAAVNALDGVSGVSRVYFLPTEDEWYKAAYYDPNSESYNLYGTGKDTIDGTEANYNASGRNSVTKVGTFEVSTHLPSAYGAYDMAGNLHDWTETFDGDSDNPVFRGGAYVHDASGLAASGGGSSLDPDGAYRVIGFRVASIPEPASVTMLLMGAVAALLWRRRRNG